MRVAMILSLGVALLWSGLVPAQDKDKAVVAPREQWTNLFAEKDITLHVQVKAPQALAGRVAWTFAAENGRVLAKGRGEVPVKAAANEAVEVKIPLTTPPLKEGVVLATKLNVALIADGAAEAAATFEQTLYIFHADPFVERRKWLEELKLTLWDPDPKEKTAEAFRALKVPFEAAVNVNALAAVKEGIVIVGAGASFKDEPALAETLLHAMQRGVPVVCFAPANGGFRLPGPLPEGVAPAAIHLRRNDVITAFDKRLDARAWATDGKIVASSFELKAEEGHVVAEIAAKSGGWPWLEIEAADAKARLIVSGFALIGQWETSPAPRYLFARLLEHVSKAADKAEGK